MNIYRLVVAAITATGLLVVGSCGGNAETIDEDSFTLWMEFSPGRTDLTPILVGDQQVSSSDAMKTACFNVAEWKANRSLNPKLIVGTNERFVGAYILADNGLFSVDDIKTMEEYLIADELALDRPAVVPDPEVLQEYITRRDAAVAELDADDDRRIVAYVTAKTNDRQDLYLRVVDLDMVQTSALDGLEGWLVPCDLIVAGRRDQPDIGACNET